MFAVHTHTQRGAADDRRALPAGGRSSSSSATRRGCGRPTRRRTAIRSAPARSPAPAFRSTGSSRRDLLGFGGPTRQHLRQHRHGRLPARERVGDDVCCSPASGASCRTCCCGARAEFGYVRFGDGFVQASSIMPQKRNPVAIEHARAIGSKALGQAQAIVTTVHNTPFGDIVDTEDDLQPLVFVDVPRRGARGAAGGGRDPDGGVRCRAPRGARGRGLDDADRAGRHAGARARPAVQDGARHRGEGAQVAGGRTRRPNWRRCSRPCASRRSDVRCRTPKADLQRILSPRHFVEVRRTLGGPAPEETARALAASRGLIGRDHAWLDSTPRRAGGGRDAARRERAAAL